MNIGADLKVHKKTKFKKVYWLLAGLAAVPVILVLLLLYKPARYDSLKVTPGGSRRGQVSPYLTHELLPQLYNGAQRQEPFELAVSQKGINEAIVLSKWPKESDGIIFFAPKVLFAANSIVLMGTTAVDGAEFVVTVELDPILDEEGLLNLRVVKVRVGVVNITPLARPIARKMYFERFGRIDSDPEDLQARIAASLLDNEPFEPVFEIDDKKVRVEKITITQGKLTLRLVPVSD